MKDHYDGREDYFKAIPELYTHPVDGRAHSRTNVIPDTINCELPLDQQRGPGHRAFFWKLAGNSFHGFIAEYPPGRYTKTHAHESGPVLICLKGKGYTITWPRSLGTTPWKDGKGHLVKRVDYVPGGIVSAAPGDADWFHGHFGVSREDFRLMAFLGSAFPSRIFGAPGDEVISRNLDLKQGGNTIEYRDEDPQVRKDFETALRANGAQFQMPEHVYR
jgi:hypothetical protein